MSLDSLSSSFSSAIGLVFIASKTLAPHPRSFSLSTYSEAVEWELLPVVGFYLQHLPALHPSRGLSESSSGVFSLSTLNELLPSLFRSQVFSV